MSNQEIASETGTTLKASSLTEFKAMISARLFSSETDQSTLRSSLDSLVGVPDLSALIILLEQINHRGLFTDIKEDLTNTLIGETFPDESIKRTLALAIVRFENRDKIVGWLKALSDEEITHGIGIVAGAIEAAIGQSLAAATMAKVLEQAGRSVNDVKHPTDEFRNFALKVIEIRTATASRALANLITSLDLELYGRAPELWEMTLQRLTAETPESERIDHVVEQDTAPLLATGIPPVQADAKGVASFIAFIDGRNYTSAANTYRSKPQKRNAYTAALTQKLSEARRHKDIVGVMHCTKTIIKINELVPDAISIEPPYSKKELKDLYTHNIDNASAVSNFLKFIAADYFTLIGIEANNVSVLKARWASNQKGGEESDDALAERRVVLLKEIHAFLRSPDTEVSADIFSNQQHTLTAIEDMAQKILSNKPHAHTQPHLEAVQCAKLLHKLYALLARENSLQGRLTAFLDPLLRLVRNYHKKMIKKDSPLFNALALTFFPTFICYSRSNDRLMRAVGDEALATHLSGLKSEEARCVVIELVSTHYATALEFILFVASYSDLTEDLEGLQKVCELFGQKNLVNAEAFQIAYKNSEIAKNGESWKNLGDEEKRKVMAILAPFVRSS